MKNSLNNTLIGLWRWYLFRSWGRVGTKIGDSKLEDYRSKNDALDQFINLYEEKTGNTWKNRKDFVKLPGKLYPLDIDYGEVLLIFYIKKNFKF